jgi:hypothetical protein
MRGGAVVPTVAFLPREARTERGFVHELSVRRIEQQPPAVAPLGQGVHSDERPVVADEHWG